jgi:hypothetical protein
MQQLKFIGGIGFTLVIAAGAGAAYIYSGAFDVAASTPHNAFEQSLFSTALRALGGGNVSKYQSAATFHRLHGQGWPWPL